MKKKTKICIVSVHPEVKTGYGIQCKNFCDILTSIPNVEVCVYTVFGNQEYVDTYIVNDKQVKIYPSRYRNVWGNFFFMEQIESPDIYWGIWDGFGLIPEILESRNWFHMFMVDTEPIHPANLNALDKVKFPIGITNWSTKIIDTALSLENKSSYIPLATDPTEFYQVEGARNWFKETFQVDEVDKIFSFVGANIGTDGEERKNIPGLIEWFHKRLETNPNDILYLHTDIMGTLSTKEGFNIQRLINFYGGRTDRIRYCNPVNCAFGRFKSSYMRNIYSASDAMIVPSYSEGFGVPYVESAMCNTPPVGLDFGAGREVIKTVGGQLIKCTPKLFCGCCNKANCTIQDIDDAVNRAISMSKKDLQQLSSNAKKYYSLDTVKDMTLKLLENSLKEIS